MRLLFQLKNSEEEFGNIDASVYQPLCYVGCNKTCALGCSDSIKNCYIINDLNFQDLWNFKRFIFHFELVDYHGKKQIIISIYDVLHQLNDITKRKKNLIKY